MKTRLEQPNADIPAACLVRAARGFSCLFWGIPLGLLLFSSQTAGFHGAIAVRAFRGLRLPTYVLAVVVMFAGILYLYRAGPLTRSWLRYVRWTALVMLLQMYFAPFYHWWDRMPHESLFMANVLGLLASTAWTLYLVNQLAALTGLATDDDTFYIEAKLCGWSIILLMVLPLAAVAIIAMLVAVRHESSLYSAVIQVQQDIPRWSYALFLLPFTLTMASTWKAKETCLHRLKKIVPPADTAD